jgi:DNA-binding SARP family transcriptional activator
MEMAERGMVQGAGAGEDTPSLELRVFGAVELTGRSGLDSLLSQPKRTALLVYLTLARPRGFHRRDRIVGLFWPEHDQEHARAALRKALYAVRQVVGENVLTSRGDEELGVDRAALRCDAIEFDEAVQGDRLARALELYAGDLLEGFFADAPGFERWLETERARYRDAAAQAAWTLAERYESGNNLTLAARWARKVAVLASSDERALRRVMRLLQRAGDRAGAVQAFEDFVARLQSEFNVGPSEETLALMREIRGR